MPMFKNGKDDSGTSIVVSENEVISLPEGIYRKLFPGDFHENFDPPGDKKKKKNRGYEESPNSHKYK